MTIGAGVDDILEVAPMSNHKKGVEAQMMSSHGHHGIHATLSVTFRIGISFRSGVVKVRLRL